MEKTTKTKTTEVVPAKVSVVLDADKPVPKNFQDMVASCNMRVCYNPTTGKIELVYGKKCPAEYIEKIAGKIFTKGMDLTEDKEDVLD
jgi:hypothetical protein